MDKSVVKAKIEASLAKTKDGWKGSGHKTAIQALRWGMAFNEAEMCRDSWNARDWTETFMYGIKPTPKTMGKLVEYVADICQDEEELEAYLADMEIFYTK